MVGSVSFPAGAAMLHFHPKFSSTLLVASASGLFSLSDTQGSTYNQTYQVGGVQSSRDQKSWTWRAVWI